MSKFTDKLIKVANLNDATRDLIDEASARTLEALFCRMTEVNEHLNLTAITDEDGVILKHFVDSVAIVPYLNEGARVADIGCGGGFPTLPIAILRDDVSVFGLDSVTKKVNYVSETATLLGLGNVTTSNARAEVLGQDRSYRESFDVACARGVGRLNLLLELCLPLVRVGGYFIAMKALTAPDEIDEAKNALCTLGASVDRVINYTLTDGSETLSRSIIIIKKTTHTPPKYPRNNSQISKKPL